VRSIGGDNKQKYTSKHSFYVFAFLCSFILCCFLRNKRWWWW